MNIVIKWGIWVVLCLGPLIVSAQSIDDEIQRLILDYQKLSQYKQSLQNLYNAYTIVEKGYIGIREIVHGNFDLHKAFLDALLDISPVVRGYARTGHVIDQAGSLVKEYKAALNTARGSGHFSGTELDYLGNVYNDVIGGSLKRLDELTMVITAGVLRMSDSQRLSAIDRIDQDIGDRLIFLRRFNANVAMQAGMRNKAGIDIGAMSIITE